MTAAELAALVREYSDRAVATALAPVLAANKALELRVLELETRPAEPGPAGAKGDPGVTGAGIASLLVSAEGRLMAHLTDGKTVDAGPIPHGTPGAPGPKGDPGDKGDAGLNGKDGAPGLAGEPGPAGKDADLGHLPDLISAEVTKAMQLLPAPAPGAPGLNGKDGSSVTAADVAPLITSEVQKAVAAVPVPKDGTSVTVADVAPIILREVEQAIKSLPVPQNGRDGKDADMPALQQAVEHLVQKAVAAVPVPKDGKDGAGVTEAMLDRAGHLVLTLSDGRTKDVGLVMGRDADALEMKRLIDEAVATIPPPKDGKDGLDGMTIDDVDLAFDAASGWALQVSAGGRTKSFPLPIPFDVGPWTAGATYPAGAGVSWDGGYWIAKRLTMEQPGSDEHAWRLVVRRGKQGKEGPRGKDGRDLTPSNTPPLY